MNLVKSETNNVTVAVLSNVRPHSNANKLRLATALGAQVVVGLDAKDGDVVLYFDPNLRLSDAYLKANNLYSNSELNADATKKGYFGKNGRVRCQKFRGEVSNGYVAELASLINIKEVYDSLYVNYDTLLTDLFKVGDEFTHIDGVEICTKYVIPQNMPGAPGSRNRRRKTRVPTSNMFHQHWNTKQLMKEFRNIPPGVVYIEEKLHGSSGRSANVIVKTNRPWYKFWVPKEKWMVLSGTRRVDGLSGHMVEERKEIEAKLAPHLHKCETVYYEIFGHQKNGSEVQKGFSYGCAGGEYKVMLYRVTITTPDGFTVDFPREMVYRRADELGLMRPILIKTCYMVNLELMPNLLSLCQELVHGNSAIANHMKEGVVVWFQNRDGSWSNLKHKSEEFLMLEDGQRESGIGDAEDNL